MENPIKMDDLGENPPFKETPISYVDGFERSNGGHVFDPEKVPKNSSIFNRGHLDQPFVGSFSMVQMRRLRRIRFQAPFFLHLSMVT